ncbi:P-loop NTPase fold protein [uncultured Duncaniella sp.]|uniref:P-loop NTPase fold protein n=1 Tax=uncultured Duncaniella sp. TaxID=2768039 RepID=UPI00272DC3AB|nr:P-loop NTPase fold protein [uncultured Duncaniella sp.]
MTIKELKNDILYALYKRFKDNKIGAIQLTELCKENGLIYDSKSQLSSAAQSLKDSGFIKITLFTNGDGIIMGLTANGIEYVEENLLTQEDLIVDGLNGTSKMVENGNLNIDDSGDISLSEKVSSPFDNTIKVYAPKENIKTIKDIDVEPCFSVNEIANSFISQLDKISESQSENIPMIGVFAPWGRGKSYFLNIVFEQLKNRNKKWYQKPFFRLKPTDKKYKIIKFDAWKYQDTPAIWAYLYETIYKAASRTQKCLLFFKNLLWSRNFWILALLIVLSWFIGFLFKTYTSWFNNISDLTALGGIGTIITLTISFAVTLRDNPVSALRIINKYSERKSYIEYLGIQNAIESDIEDLLKILSRGKKRVLLCVDDIDRCSNEKMVNIVDSLRTVLENDKIRERLIVICSIDIKKLMHGYELLYADDNSGIREQIDKVFIFCMGLAGLGQSQLKEYLQKMMSIKNQEISEPIGETFFNINRQTGALYATDPNVEPTPLSDNEIYNIISKYIDRTESTYITPRKLRIMYYQLLFANNLASKRGVILTNDLINVLLNKSLKGSVVDSGQALGDIIEMAVPY